MKTPKERAASLAEDLDSFLERGPELLARQALASALLAVARRDGEVSVAAIIAELSAMAARKTPRRDATIRSMWSTTLKAATRELRKAVGLARRRGVTTRRPC